MNTRVPVTTEIALRFLSQYPNARPSELAAHMRQHHPDGGQIAVETARTLHEHLQSADALASHGESELSTHTTAALLDYLAARPPHRAKRPSGANAQAKGQHDPRL